MRLAGHKSVVVFCCCFEQIVHTSEKACGQRCSDNVLSILCTKKQYIGDFFWSWGLHGVDMATGGGGDSYRNRLLPPTLVWSLDSV